MKRVSSISERCANRIFSFRLSHPIIFSPSSPDFYFHLFLILPSDRIFPLLQNGERRDCLSFFFFSSIFHFFYLSEALISFFDFWLGSYSVIRTSAGNSVNLPGRSPRTVCKYIRNPSFSPLLRTKPRPAAVFCTALLVCFLICGPTTYVYTQTHSAREVN